MTSMVPIQLLRLSRSSIQARPVANTVPIPKPRTAEEPAIHSMDFSAEVAAAIPPTLF